MSVLAGEKDAVEKKLARLEKSRESETTDLRGQLQSAQDGVRGQLRAKDAKLAEARRCWEEGGALGGSCSAAFSFLLRLSTCQPFPPHIPDPQTLTMTMTTTTNKPQISTPSNPATPKP